MRLFAKLGAAAALVAVISSVRAARAEAPTAWETWPSGRLFDATERPVMKAPELRVCSFTQPVCVHASYGTSAQSVMSTLEEAERAMELLRDQALLPPPMADFEGGSGDFDLYLGDTVGAAFRAHEDVSTSVPVDRGSAFAILDQTLADGCARRTAIHRAVATSLLLAIDGGAAGSEIASVASYLAGTTTGCTTELLEAIDDAQREPQNSSFSAGDIDEPRPSPLLPYYLEDGFGAGGQGSLLTALFYAARQTTPASATRFHNDVDLMTVVSRVAKGAQKKLDDALLDYALTRAFLGDRSDGQHLAALDFAGTFARPHFDAVWKHSELPKTVAFAPLEPTGSTFVWLDLADAPKGLAIAFQSEWESPVTMRWALIRVAKDGHEVSRIEVTWEKGIRHVQRSILELDGLAGLLVVGVSSGEVDLKHPYRIDETPVEPHGGTVSLLRDEPLTGPIRHFRRRSRRAARALAKTMEGQLVERVGDRFESIAQPPRAVPTPVAIHSSPPIGSERSAMTAPA